MDRKGRLVLRWAILTATALTIGSLIGTVYALNFKEPVLTFADEPRRGTDWPPSAPSLSSPANRAIVASNAPEFAWEASDDDRGHVIYTIEFSYDASFGTGVFRRYTNIEETTFRVPSNEPFAPGLEVYWRVYALDLGLNQSPYSETFAFTPLQLPVAQARS